jgi:dynein heavy chain, axonemal
MCSLWSLGGSVTTECRKPFDLFIKKLFALDIKFPDIKTKKIYVPDRGQVYDYQFITKEGGTDGQWVNWNDLIDKTETISDKMMPSEIIVKTMDTMRYSFFL